MAVIQELVVAKEGHDRLIYKTFHDLPYNRQKRDWTIVGRIGGIAWLGHRLDSSKLPGRWNLTTLKGMDEEICKRKSQFRSAFFQNNSWNTVMTRGLIYVKPPKDFKS